MAAVVHDQQHAAAVLGTAEHDNIFVGEAVAHRITTRRVSFSSSRARVRSTSGWPAACTRPSRCSPSTSTSAQQLFRRARYRPARRSSSTGPDESWSAPTERSRPSSRWSTRWRSCSNPMACAPRPWPATASASTWRPPWQACSTSPTAIKCVAMRARLMHASPPGAMVAVPLSPEAIAEHLSPASTSPRSTIRVAAWSPGRQENIRKFTESACRRGDCGASGPDIARVPFRLMDPVVPEFEEFLSPDAPQAAHTRCCPTSPERG